MAEGPITFLMDNLGLLCRHGNLLSSNSKDQVFELVGELQKLKEFSILSRSQDVLQRRIIIAVHEVEDTIDSCLVAELVGIRRLLIPIREKAGLGILSFRVEPFVLHKLKWVIRRLMEAPHELYSHPIIDEEKCKEVGRMQNPREDNVVGLKDELDTLIGYLMEDSDKLGVISITGMPGIGKTTMAWRIYNDTRIRYEFPCLVWVRVPQHFNIRDVCLNIMTSITSEDLSTKEYVELISMVSTYLMCKKFLIIMDDVWTSEAWNEIKDVLPMQNAQGKVLITTINDNVAIHANRDRNPHNLRFLTSEESWELLQVDAFGKTNAYPPELEELGNVIVDRCKGLPLSVVVAANFIVEKGLRVWVPDQWRTLVDLSDYLADHYACRNTMSRIYDSLPDDLKECFLYLAMFPKDTEIPVWKLIRLWIAEGFIRRESKKSLEEIGQENLRELRDRNLLVFDTVNICGEVKTCRIHSMVHEYCKNKAAKLTGFLEEPRNGLSCYRRFCIHSCVRELFLERLYICMARSILFFPEKPIALEAREISSIISDFRLIRVLDAHAIRFPIFPSKITKMIHLRYITLSVDDLKILPESISTFWNLQTLVVSTASRTLEIKASIWKMTQLRHLKTKSSIFLQNRKGEGGYNLQTLTKLSPQSFTNEVSKKARNLVELGIRGRLSDSLYFGDLRLLEKLSLEHDVYPKDNFENPLLILPKQNTFPPKLKSLVLSGTYLDWMHMSTLGCLPALEVLKLKNNAFWGSTWETDDGFENLRALSIEQTNLKYWVAPTYSFHKLRTVEFRNCEQLVQIPEDLGLTLEGLLMSGVTKYAVAYAKKIEQKMALKGSSRKIEQKMALEGSSSSNSKRFNDQAHFRHEFYQRPEEVVVTIFAKGIPSNCVVVDFGEQILSVTIEVPGEKAYHFQPRLFGKIVPEKCRYDVMSTQIEIQLAKADAVDWTSLEFSTTAAVVQKAVIPSGSQTPTYPSSKLKRVDWGKQETQVKKAEKEEELDVQL